LTSKPVATKSSAMLSSADLHKDFARLIVSTREVGVMGFHLNADVKAASLSALLLEPTNQQFSWTSRDVSQVSFAIEKETEASYKVRVQGELKLWSNCVKCLNDLEHVLELDFTIRMLKSAQLLEEDCQPSSMVFASDSQLEEDCLVGYFSLESIDLGLILREQIFLSVPDYPQCLTACEQASVMLLSAESGQENPFVKLFSKI